MMPQKNSLHELLKEDQEPFLLNNYIADRRSQLKRPSPKTHLQLKKRKPLSHSHPPSSYFPHSLCKSATCFSSFTNNSPDPSKSPLFDFHSPAKSPNSVFLHIPARTASLLLEAALRIQKHSSNSKPKPHNRNNGFSLFGSLLKRLTHLNKPPKRQITAGDPKFANERDEQQPEKVTLGGVIEKSGSFSCYCNGSPSSAVWSETNVEDKSLDLEASSSGLSEDLLVAREFAAFDQQHFCESPFHFVLRRNTSSGHRTPDLFSPAASPTHHKGQKKKQDRDNKDQSLKKIQVEEGLEEEEKEQCSPVSVLDPPFEDDDYGHDDDPSEDGGFDLERSYALVQKAKQQLLAKLRRFEKLAELDPVELEKRMLEQDEEDEDDYEGDAIINDLKEDETCEEQLVSSYRQRNMDSWFIVEELSKSRDMKRLVWDLMQEEEREQNYVGGEGEGAAVKRVCKRLESWKEVESNTIDMMVEQDFKRELEGWKMNQEQIGVTAVEIEVAIFGLLVEELSKELINWFN